MPTSISPSEHPISRSRPAWVRRGLLAGQSVLLMPWIGGDALRVTSAVPRANALLVTTRDHFYKIGRSPRNTIALEYEKYRHLASCCAELTPHLPEVRFWTRFHRPILQMNRIHFAESNEMAHRHAHAALDLLRRKAHAGTPADWKAFPYLQAGVDRARSCIDAARFAALERILEKASRQSCRIGPVYGDFHHENLLSVGDGQFYLIDPVCFMPAGIQAYDALHYIAYWTWKASGKEWSHWMDAAIECQRSGWAIPGCEPIARNFVDVDLSVAGVFYATARLGQLTFLLGDGWQMPERQKAGLSALVDQCMDGT